MAQFGERLSSDYANFWIRLVCLIIDASILAVLIGAFGHPVILGGPDGAFIGFLAGIVYVVGMNANGATLPKRAFGLRLEDTETGKDIGYVRALGRYGGAMLSAYVLLLGYFAVIRDDKNRTWHDKSAGSVVVKQ